MKHDYLWDRQGEPDPEIAQLEQVLRPLRHRPLPFQAPAWPAPVTVGESAPSGRLAWRGPALMLALAATLVLLVRITWPGTAFSPSPWTVEFQPVDDVATPVRVESALQANQWVVTGTAFRATLRAANVGVVEVEPGSRVRVVPTTGDEHRLALSRGVVHAFIWAKPGQFYVDTPSVTAIDLGCAYTLEVDTTGRSRVRVTSGWVGIAHNGNQAFVPAGATCRTQPDGTPGTPRRQDATPQFARALDILDETRGRADARALGAVLEEAQKEDAFSLWHLLTRLPAADADRVYRRLAVLAPPPPAVTLELVLARDRAALDAWWNSLGLGDTEWYRLHTAETGASPR